MRFRSFGTFDRRRVVGEHPADDTVAKRFRHLNFFQHGCFREVRAPRVKLPDGAVRQIEPPWISP